MYVIPLKLFLDIVPSPSADVTRALRGCFVKDLSLMKKQKVVDEKTIADEKKKKKKKITDEKKESRMKKKSRCPFQATVDSLSYLDNLFL